MWWEIWLFWKDFQNKAVKRIDPPKLSRKRRTSPGVEQCLGVNSAPEFEKDIVYYYRKIYSEALNCITTAITDRFGQQDSIERTSNRKAS